MSTNGQSDATRQKEYYDLPSAVVRFSGDSGDGMQLAGSQFADIVAAFGNDICTLPDFPAEIRAPAGTVGGVSAFQVSFAQGDIHTPGDEIDTLIAMNPAALKTSLGDLRLGGTVIVNTDAFIKNNLKKAGYEENPLEDEQFLKSYDVQTVPMTTLTREAVKDLGMGSKEADLCKNFFALGLVCWLYERELDVSEEWAAKKFRNKKRVLEGNLAAIRSGYNYGNITESVMSKFRVPRAALPPGLYRKVTGNEAIALGLVTAAKLAGKELLYSGYPITPASDILHALSRYKNYGVKTFQAEDEIAAMASTVGAAYSGALAVTGSSGPGICLKLEAMGLAVITELPMVIINVQRGGPSTGLPTKTEQSDLLQMMFGRNGESPMPILAPQSPADCFKIIQEALRIAVEFMTPVGVLSDGYIGNGSEPWQIPDISDLKPIAIEHPKDSNNPDGDFLPYVRNEKLARPWAIPGTKDLEHRVGGLEKWDKTGHVAYDPDNHQKMTDVRAQKVEKIAETIPLQDVFGCESGDLLLVSWGGPFGAIRTAAEKLRDEDLNVGHVHIRYLNPFPSNLGEIFSRFNKVVVAELNSGQLRLLLRAKYLVDAEGINQVKGKPFRVSSVIEAAKSFLES